MDIFKVLIQKLSIFRNNSALLIPIAIGLVSVLLFIPTQLMSSRLKKQIESESISTIGTSIQSLSKGAVSREQWKKEQERQRDYASDANEIALLAKRSTQRELLSYKIFPDPEDKTQFTFVEFGKRYCTELETLVSGINGHECITEAEIKRALEKSSGRSGLDSKSRSTDFYAGLSAKSSGTLHGGRSDVDDTIVEEMCRQRAESTSVYVNLADFSGYRFWREYKYDGGVQKAVEDCWYYQLAYWIIEDVIGTIGDMNKEAGLSSVQTSPVKRLMGIYFNLGGGGYRAGGKNSGQGPSDKAEAQNASADKPVYVISLEKATIAPYTGRCCNDNIDVVHFNVVVIVSAKAVLPFMKQLCSAKEHKFAGLFGNEQEQIYKHNQITILESNISSINREDQIHSLYRYGDEAVVELSLLCEYIFNKAGYEEIKPASVKGTQKPAEKPVEKKESGPRRKAKQSTPGKQRDTSYGE